MITVGFDARTYFFRSGLGRYCRNVLHSMLEEGNECRFIIWLSNQKTLADFPRDPGEMAEIHISQAPFGDYEAENTILRQEVNESSADVFYSPYSPVPCGIQIPGVLTVHDLTAIKFPEMHLDSTTQYLRSSLPRCLESAAAVVADSCQTALDVVDFFPKAASRISVIPLGVDNRFFTEINASLLSASLKQLRLKEEEYLLFVGNLESRKNLLRTVQAYARSTLCGHIPLVLAGTPRWGSEELFGYIEQHHLESQVLILDHVPDEHLPALYRGALFFVYVSLYEGFGLPVLEAMASGTPVLISNTSSLPEVAGESALYVNPRNIEEIRAGMERLRADASLRKRLSNLGLSRSRCFLWRRTAKDLLQILTKVAERKESICPDQSES